MAIVAHANCAFDFGLINEIEDFRSMHLRLSVMKEAVYAVYRV